MVPYTDSLTPTILEAANSQYEAQVPLGRQSIIQLVKNKHWKENLTLTLDKIFGYLEGVLQKIGIKATVTRKYKVGDGGVILVSATDGNIMVVWDGKEHVDVNMFTFRQSIELADSFRENFIAACGKQLIVGLRDDQPRGTGRVINFMSDIV
jgi:hypothetical protein